MHKIPIAPGVTQLALAPRQAINAYLIGAILVDAGIRVSAPGLLGALAGRTGRCSRSSPTAPSAPSGYGSRGAEVVLVLGAEISLLNKGFLPGDTLVERVELLSNFQRLRALIPKVPAQVNGFLARAVAVVRERFGGKVTYAAMPFEGVDWGPFDIISLDLYRSAEVAGRYADGIRSLVAQGKPVAITEFGSATYTGAADKGARGGEIIAWDEAVVPLGLNGDYARNEEEQARYIRELLEIFVEQGVDSAFVCTFVQYQLPHRPSPRDDLDMGSYSIVKVYEDRLGETYPDMAWEPKAAFAALADCYGRSPRP